MRDGSSTRVALPASNLLCIYNFKQHLIPGLPLVFAVSADSGYLTLYPINARCAAL